MEKLLIGVAWGTLMTISFFSIVDYVPHEKPMIEKCERNGTTLERYDQWDFSCSDGATFDRDFESEDYETLRDSEAQYEIQRLRKELEELNYEKFLNSK